MFYPPPPSLHTHPHKFYFISPVAVSADYRWDVPFSDDMGYVYPIYPHSASAIFIIPKNEESDTPVFSHVCCACRLACTDGGIC